MKKLNTRKSFLAVLLIVIATAGGVYAFRVVKNPETTGRDTANQDAIIESATDDARQTDEPQQQPQIEPGEKTESLKSDKPMDAPAGPNIEKKPEAVKPPEEN